MKLKADSPLHVSLAFSSEEVPVGRLALDRGVVALEYAPEFVGGPRSLNPLHGIPAAGLVWPRDRRAFGGLHGMFGDSLPDAWGDLLIRRRAERAGMSFSSLTVLDKLAIIGSRGLGALVYRPLVPDDARVDQIDLDVLASASNDVIEGKNSDVLPELERLGGSSGGARPKVLVAMNGEGHLIAADIRPPHGYESWLVKFRSHRNDPVDVGPLEAAYADMARAAGIDVSETRLLAGRGGGYFATRRFDRPSARRRLHVASVAGLLDAPWDASAFTYEDLLKLVRAITHDHRDVEQMYRRMSFNVLAHNRDDHIKQHSFLMDEGGAWTLAPAYDLLFSNGPGNEHYLSVSGRAGDDIDNDMLLTAGVDQGISRRRCKEFLDEASAAVARFVEFAQTYGVSAATTAEVVRGTR